MDDMRNCIEGKAFARIRGFSIVGWLVGYASKKRTLDMIHRQDPMIVRLARDEDVFSLTARKRQYIKNPAFAPNRSYGHLPLVWNPASSLLPSTSADHWDSGLCG